MKQPSEEDAQEGESRTHQTHRVFQKYREYDRILAANDLVPGAFIGILLGQQFLVGNAPRVEVEGSRQAKHRVVPSHMAGRMRPRKMGNALIEGQQAADSENVNRD